MTLCSTKSEAPSGSPGTFKEALLTVLDKKATTAMLRPRSIAPQERPPVSQDLYRACQGDHLSVRGASKTPQCSNDGCHREAAHQGQRRSAL